MDARAALWPAAWKDEAFSQRVADLRREQVGALTGQLTALGPQALEAVRSCLDEERPSDRLRAASLVLSLILKFRELHDLEREVAEIKRLLTESAVGRADV